MPTSGPVAARINSGAGAQPSEVRLPDSIPHQRQGGLHGTDIRLSVTQMLLGRLQEALQRFSASIALLIQ